MKKAFTVLELVFVIVIIGILSAVAIPKLSSTVEDAYKTKAKDTVASVRIALSTLRQKNILKGNFDDINYSTIGETFSNLLTIGIKKCTTDGCGGWETTDTDANHPEFTFHAPSGDVVFKVENNMLNCTSAESVCKEYDE